MVQVSEGVREGMRKYWDTVEVLPVSFIRQNASRADAASSLVHARWKRRQFGCFSWSSQMSLGKSRVDRKCVRRRKEREKLVRTIQELGGRVEQLRHSILHRTGGEIEKIR